jgi:hypothetical protein
MNAMRKTETGGWGVQNSSNALLRALQLATVVVGIGLVVGTGAARAQDDEEEDDSSFSDKIIRNVMTGIGGTNMENRGIEYRERSPLVVPPKIDLPPPQAANSEARAANWPKDPEIQARKARAAAKNTGRPEEVLEAARPLTPSEMAPKRAKVSSSAIDNNRPGEALSGNAVLSPSQLGVDGGMLKNMFGGGASVQTAPFKGEPPRESLTEPPVGYQTPSPGYAYGTGPKEALKNSADINPMTGKY